MTSKHKRLTNATQKNEKNEDNQNTFNCYCGNIYKHKSSYYKHKKKCEITNIEKETCLSDKNLILTLIQQNNELQKQMIELSKNIGNNNNNITNNKFNLKFFLNETCKDAMNITDFVSSIKLQLTDLENVGKNGYVNGISSIIVKNLNSLEINKRPVHCCDLKREIMYVKDENKWEKEKEKEKLSKAINKVSYKNVLQIPEWQKEHPGCEYSHNKENDKYLHIVHESMGASTEEDKKENINKIITKIAKEVVIEKEAD
jgi:hypothetical protein